MSQNNNHSLDVTIDLRRRAREVAEQQRIQRLARAELDAQLELKTEYEQLVRVDLPEAEQEQERVNLELQEPPPNPPDEPVGGTDSIAPQPIPPEGRLKMNLIKAGAYALIAGLMGIAGILLAFSVLDFVFYALPALVRWVIAIAAIGLTIVGFHWTIRQMSLRMRRLLIVVLLFVALANLVVWAWIRAEYSSVRMKQETGHLTADEAQQRTEKLDAILIFVHAVFALALESLGAVAASRAADLFDRNWPELEKYRRRRYWEQVYAKLLKRKIELEIQLKRYANKAPDGEMHSN